MDCSLPVVSDDGDVPWSDSPSMDSDDGQSMISPNSPLWMDHFPSNSSSMSVSSTMSNSQTDQLSPISNGIDNPGALAHDGTCVLGASGPSSTPNMIHSASSSSTDSWGLDYVDSDDVAGIETSNADIDMHWEQDSDDILTIPKLEPLDDEDIRLEELKAVPLASIPSANGLDADQPKPKRPRGRPRKHPLTPIVTTNKITKGRSKTGCLTCRKRKKKCDEAKPRCMNCEKNAVVCEGYPEKQIWKSGKERAEEERLKSYSLPSITLQPIFHGLETIEDRIFWKHYNEHLSTVLTVEGEHKNAFKDMIVPIAVKHQGLMHSILSLSSKHIDYDTPYGVNLLRNNPSTTLEALQERSEFHHDKAYEKLWEDKLVDRSNPEYNDVLTACYGQMLCFLLESLAEGNPRGEHRVHLNAYQVLTQNSPPEDPAFLAFITEFFQYHIFADELLRYPDPDDPEHQPHRLATEDWTSPVAIHPPRLLGVADGLFNYLSQITTIRNTIRKRTENRWDPPVDYGSLYRAAEIDAAIRDWTPHWPPGDSRERVGLLYKQMMWVYLYRTIYPPSQSSPSSSSSSASLSVLPPPALAGCSKSLVNTPPLSASTSCSSLPTLPSLSEDSASSVFSHTDSCLSPLSRKNSSANATITGQTSNTGRAESPKPIRQPPNHDLRVTAAIESCLAILESVKPSDPSQTLLLIPCLVIGTSCFAPAQQERVRGAVRTIRGYTGLRNTDRVAELLEEVWRLMDAGDWLAVWDWQKVARGLGIDFLCT